MGGVRNLKFKICDYAHLRIVVLSHKNIGEKIFLEF